MASSAPSVIRMLKKLGAVTEDEGGLTRTFLSPAMRRANALVAEWMKAVGLIVREDSVGNLMGTWPAANGTWAKTLLLGSHLDTVRDAGKYDGPLGVLLPIAAIAELKRKGVTLPFNVEVLGFSEEEGVRFASAYLGSKGFVGALNPAALKLKDASGTSVREALAEFNGGKFSLPKPAFKKKALLGYVEVHIEQGPVLEAQALPVGVVSAIAGQSRFQITWTGKAGHAGTTPMALRHDAFTGAAEFALMIEKLARTANGLMATVGAVSVFPGAANVIPGRVVHTLDVRHARDAVRKTALRHFRRLAAKVARQRGLTCTWKATQENPAVACDAKLTDRLLRSVKTVQTRGISLVSGAGHDGVILSTLTPIAMLFVRCRDGLSHHPDEYAAPRDVAVAQRVLVDFLESLGSEYQ